MVWSERCKFIWVTRKSTQGAWIHNSFNLSKSFCQFFKGQYLPSKNFFDITFCWFDVSLLYTTEMGRRWRIILPFIKLLFSYELVISGKIGSLTNHLWYSWSWMLAPIKVVPLSLVIVVHIPVRAMNWWKVVENYQYITQRLLNEPLLLLSISINKSMISIFAVF